VTAIADTEARPHAASPAEIHLHELGGHHTLIDIVAVAGALHALGVTAVHSSPLPLGTGHVRAGHGVLHVLTRPEDTPALRELIFTETGTLGIRCAAVSRTPLSRRTTTIDPDGVPVRVKHGPATVPTGAIAVTSASPRSSACSPASPVSTAITGWRREPTPTTRLIRTAPASAPAGNAMCTRRWMPA
jgi:uncharacterized protein (DUF111 family)